MAAKAGKPAAKIVRKVVRPVFVVDGSRTPFLKARGKPGAFSAANLAMGAARPLLMRQAFAAGDLDEVIILQPEGQTAEYQDKNSGHERHYRDSPEQYA